MTSEKTPKFCILCVLDGWGIAKDGPGNAITNARTPYFNKYWNSFPHTQLGASGESVGLPRGEDGNTETGHINLGAGKIVYQDLERINMSIADGSFYENPVLNAAIDHAKKNNSNLHLIGLVGAGGVHSNLEHLFSLIRLCSTKKLDRVFIHVFTDGRDSPQTSAQTYLETLEKVILKEKVGKIASIMGRYWAMDRDQRWDRTEKAYNALTKGNAKLVKSPYDEIKASYKEGKTDEFIEPCLITENGNDPVTLVNDNDSVIFFNFRIDRPVQLTKTFVLTDFNKANIPIIRGLSDRYVKRDFKQNTPFDRGKKLENLYFVTMTDYGKMITEEGAKPAFPPEIIDYPISSVFSNAGMQQLKITESEKERFVTFYFNGLREKPYPNEEWLIIPSPKVPTYDQKPEMASDEITNTIISKLTNDDYKFIVVNYPNADMVGHTGNIGACVKAIEKLDENIEKLANFVISHQGTLIITADHGNAEEMINLGTSEIDTEHSINPVPFITISQNYFGINTMLRSGILADIAPTILSIMNLDIPTNMSGRNLLSDISK